LFWTSLGRKALTASELKVMEVDEYGTLPWSRFCLIDDKAYREAAREGASKEAAAVIRDLLPARIQVSVGGGAEEVRVVSIAAGEIPKYLEDMEVVATVQARGKRPRRVVFRIAVNPEMAPYAGDAIDLERELEGLRRGMTGGNPRRR
jgi:hypothetical protein